jgi:hypothetical protein
MKLSIVFAAFAISLLSAQRPAEIRSVPLPDCFPCVVSNPAEPAGGLAPAAGQPFRK